MYNPAGVRTNSLGHAVSGSTIELKSTIANTRRKDIWETKMEYYKDSRVHFLIGLSQFNLIGRHLLDVAKLDPQTSVIYSKEGITRSVIVGDVEYRSNAYTLYTRRI